MCNPDWQFSKNQRTYLKGQFFEKIKEPVAEPTSKGSSLRKSKNQLQNLPQRFSSLRKSDNLSKKFKNSEPEVLIETKNHPTLDYTYTYCAV
jgi:hypothetical protein